MESYTAENCSALIGNGVAEWFDRTAGVLQLTEVVPYRHAITGLYVPLDTTPFQTMTRKLENAANRTHRFAAWSPALQNLYVANCVHANDLSGLKMLMHDTAYNFRTSYALYHALHASTATVKWLLAAGCVLHLDHWPLEVCIKFVSDGLGKWFDRAAGVLLRVKDGVRIHTGQSTELDTSNYQALVEKITQQRVAFHDMSVKSQNLFVANCAASTNVHMLAQTQLFTTYDWTSSYAIWHARTNTDTIKWLQRAGCKRSMDPMQPLVATVSTPNRVDINAYMKKPRGPAILCYKAGPTASEYFVVTEPSVSGAKFKEQYQADAAAGYNNVMMLHTAGHPTLRWNTH